MTVDAVVVGGGAIGVACAHYLQVSGWDVTLIDRDELGLGASYANAGLVVPSHSQPLNAPGAVSQGLRAMAHRDGPFRIRPRLDPALAGWLWRFVRASDREHAERGYALMAELGRASLDLYDELFDTGATAGFYRRGPLLHAYVSEEALVAAKAEVEELEAQGFRAKLLDGDEAHDLEPALGPSVLGALLVEDQAFGDCYAYLRSLAESFQRWGGRVITNRSVFRIAAPNGVVSGVLIERPGDEIRADLVVLASGAWAPTLAKDLGVRLPIQPARGYSTTFMGTEAAPRIPVMFEERRVIVTPLGDRVRVAGTLELAGYHAEPDPVRQAALLRGAREVLSGPFDDGTGEEWSGLRPLSVDGLPIIGRVPGIEGLIVAAGHGMLGYTQSPITGKLVAELAAGDPTSLPVEPYRVDRF
jgi:D-amino-acid dehydrogenase